MKDNSDIFLLCSFLLLVAGLPLLVLTHINDNLAGEAALAEHCRSALNLIARHAADGDKYCGIDIDRCIYHRSEQRKLESYYDLNCDIQRCPDPPYRCWFSARNTASWVERCVDGNWIYVRSCAEGCGNGKCFDKLVCTDTDGGKEPYTFGVVNATGNEPVYDVCMGSSVHEAYCDEDSLPQHEVFSCPHGCGGGVCLKDTCGNGVCDAGETWQTCPLDCSLERTCTDTDAGRDYFTKGTATMISDKQYIFEDVCTGNVLSEGICSDGVASYYSYVCPEECRDGACVAAEDYCYDSDRGFEPYYFGYVNSSVNEYAADYCTGIEDRLAEATCDDDLSPLYKFHTCPLGCIDGACVPDNSTCVEDDNGRNYYVKGTSSGPRRCIYGGKLADCIGGPQEHHDVCVQGGRDPVKFGINPVLNEYYCGYDGRMVLYAYLCPERCLEGSCVDPCKDLTTADERDHCYLTLVTRDNPGICSLVTSNLLREQCYEEVGKCKDSDGGADYYTKGETVGRGEGLQYEIWFFRNDTCYKDEAPQHTQYRNRLKEYKCGPEHELQLVAYDCPNGCEDGACLGTGPDDPEQPEQPTEPSDGSTPSSYNCEDTDGGIKPDQYGEVTYKLTSRDDLFRDYCYSGKVTEYYCKEGGGWAMTSIDCPNGCEDGACISEGDVQEDSVCTDSDGGKDYYVKGSITTETETLWDKCRYSMLTKSFDGVGEWYCEQGHARRTDVRCTGGCEDGVCLGEAVVPECIDEDGDDLFVKGSAKEEYGSGTNDCCFESPYGGSWVPNGSYVREGLCKTNVTLGEYGVTEKRVLCPNGCEDGACLYGSQSSDGSKDCGADVRCINDSIKACVPATGTPEIGNVTLYVEVFGPEDGHCKLYYEVLDAERLEFIVNVSITGLSSTCTPPRDEAYLLYIFLELVANATYCEGDLIYAIESAQMGLVEAFMLALAISVVGEEGLLNGTDFEIQPLTLYPDNGSTVMILSSNQYLSCKLDLDKQPTAQRLRYNRLCTPSFGNMSMRLINVPTNPMPTGSYEYEATMKCYAGYQCQGEPLFTRTGSFTVISEGDVQGDAVCTDTDGGRNYYVKGKACYGTKCGEDFCQDEYTLMENDCSDGTVGGSAYTCPNGCEDGACFEDSGELLVFNKQSIAVKRGVREVFYMGVRNPGSPSNVNCYNIYFRCVQTLSGNKCDPTGSIANPVGVGGMAPTGHGLTTGDLPAGEEWFNVFDTVDIEGGDFVVYPVYLQIADAASDTYLVEVDVFQADGACYASPTWNSVPWQRKQLYVEVR